MTVYANGTHRGRLRSRILALALTGLLGAAPALLVACGGSGKGLIPVANAGPLQSDFEAVAQAAQAAGGNCNATTAAINKTEQDFAALPSIDAGLHQRLQQGIRNLRERALVLCSQPLVQTTTTTTPARTTTTTKTEPTTTATTPTTTPTTTHTTATTPSAPSSPSTGGGTAAPSEGPPGTSREGEASESGGAQAGGQEAGK